MANETGLWIKLKAMFDKKQVEKETKDILDDAQKLADKQDIKVDLLLDRARLEKDLEQTKLQIKKFKEEGNEELELQARFNAEVLEEKLRKTKSGIKEVSDEIDELETNANDGTEALEDMGKTGNNLSGVFAKLTSKLAGFAIVIKGLSFLKDTFNDFQQAQKTLVKETGASGQALQDLSNVMLNVQGNVAQSQGEIAEAVGELNTRLGLAGDELQDFTTKYLKFASVTGQDGKQAIEDNVRMFSIWGIRTDKQAEYLDKLTVAGQKTGISVSDLTSKLQQNAPVLQELGFNLEDSIALLSNFEQAGVEASQVLQSMKMGLKNLSDDGVSPTESLQKVIKGVRDGTIDLNDAMEIFGSRGGVAMFNAIKNGTFDLENMKTALSDVQGAVEDTYNEMETFGEFISRKWNGAVASFTQWNNEGFQATRQLVNMISDKLRPGMKEATDYMNKRKIAIEGALRGEREFKIVNGVLVSQLTEEGQEAEKTRKIMEDYNTTRNEAVKAKKKFDSTKVDDSATREEFEADKIAAIETMNAFRQALIAKSEYFDSMSTDTGKGKSRRSGLILRSLEADLLKTRLSTFRKKDGGTIIEDLLGGDNGSGKSKAQEMLEEFDKELVNTWTDIDSLVKEHSNSYDDIVEDMQKVEKEYDKLKDKAQDTWKSAEKSIRNYNEELEKNQSDSLQKLGQRYVELKEKWREIDNQYLKGLVSEISSKERQYIRDENWLYEGYNYDQLKDIKELYDEIKLIEENTTEEQRKTAEFTEKTSKAQEIINDLKEKEAELEEKKAAAIEKQKIASALMSQELGQKYIQTFTKDGEDIGTWFYDVETEKREQIHDVDNIEYAKQLEQQALELDNQYEQLKQEKDNEVEIIIDATSRKIALEQEYTTVYEESIRQQKKGLDELIAKTETLIARKREYLSLGGGTLHNAYGGSVLEGKVSVVGENGPEQIIARQSSYVQPRNAGNSYNTVNNNGNSLTINGVEIGNYSSIDDMLNALKEKLTYRN